MPSPKNAQMLHAKLLSNIREIQARGAVTIVIAEEGDDTVRPYADHLIEIPAVSTLFQPLLSTIPLQVFAAGVARARGYDVDKPRNLAKSVTVEVTALGGVELMDLRVPTVNIAGRWARDGLGAFVSEAAYEHFLDAYRVGMATLPPFELFDVPTTFGTVRAYRFAGPDTGAPVLLLPGRNASTPMYRTNIEPLLKHRTVYGLDLLGEAGLSVQHKRVRDAPDQAQWLDETLAGLELEKAHLLGVSMGGWTAANCCGAPARADSVDHLAGSCVHLHRCSGQGDTGLGGTVRTWRAGAVAPEGAELDSRRSRYRGRRDGSRADLRGFNGFHAAHTDAETVHR